MNEEMTAKCLRQVEYFEKIYLIILDSAECWADAGWMIPSRVYSRPTDSNET
jgi:hypothetical protein